MANDLTPDQMILDLQQSLIRFANAQARLSEQVGEALLALEELSANVEVLVERGGASKG